MTYKTLIVDDEFLARKLLQSYVKQIPELEVAGTCANAAEARARIEEGDIDILLLDIHMPDVTGLELARTCGQVPAIIFTTAYSEYAVESYEVRAVDYLLKPIALPRFKEAIAKAIEKVDTLRSNNATQDATSSDTKDHIIVKADYKLYRINYSDILYIESQHEYVSFYTRSRRITALFSLKELETILPPELFVRVHRSFIVAINCISEADQQSCVVEGIAIPIGGNYKEHFLSVMKK